MGTGYTRNDTANNIADGNVINASDLDGEFDAIQAAFNASTGHSHDGTTGEGPQIGTGGIADNAVTLGTKTTGNYVATGAVSGVGLSGSASAEGATFTVTSNATDANTASTIVARDASGNFSAGTITASLTGTASNAALLDSLDSTQFLRSDAADSKTAGDLSFADNVKAVFGAGSDLQIYHNGSKSLIYDGGTGDLEIRATNLLLTDSDGTSLIYGQDNGAVNLYHNGSNKLQTTSTGVNVTGNITVSGTVDGRDVATDGSKLDGIESGATADQSASEILTLIKTVDGAGSGLDADTLDGVSSASFLRSDAADTKTSGNLVFNDNVQAQFGSSADLKIYHDGSNSYVADDGTGNLILRGSSQIKIQSLLGEDCAIFNENGSSSLQYDNATKLATTSSGVQVTGSVQADGLYLGDNESANFGASNDLQIYHNGTHSYIKDGGTGSLYVLAQDFYMRNAADTAGMIYAADGGAVSLYYNGGLKFQTASNGVTVTGQVTADGLALGDNEVAYFGISGDLQIYHTGSHSFIRDNGTGSLYIDATNLNFRNGAQTATYADFTNGGAARLMHNGNVKFQTTSSGIDVPGDINAVNNIYLAASIVHEGDTDTYMQFHNANEWRVVTGGTEMLEVNNDTVNLGANTIANVQVSNVASSITPNLEVYNSFVLTLTGNITLNNPATELAGMSGVFIFIHSGAGRTVSLGTDYQTAGGAGLTLSSTAGAKDIVPYFVQTTGEILLGTPQLAFA